MKVVSLFSGCGGLDLGFKKAGFDVIWANDIDREIVDTYSYNYPETILCSSDLMSVPYENIPSAEGIIGGPPCQAWSEGGRMRGLNDPRGRVFLHFIEVIRKKQPSFFVAENVPGLLSSLHRKTFDQFMRLFREAGYVLSYRILNSLNYKIPQERKRVIIVGFNKRLKRRFQFPSALSKSPISLRQAIGDITEYPVPYGAKQLVRRNLSRANHDYYVGPFDLKYMSRNRVRSWNESSFTIQALAKNAPIHPRAPKMLYVNPNKRIFKPSFEYLYRRLSVRECARIQTFPDSFLFFYSKIQAAYRMIGNAVPSRLAYVIADSIQKQLH
jgi:DNA (cytosine-5)-methyltransferase 1